VIFFDKRGTGLSDRIAGAPTLEERSDDIRAVMDAAGSDRAAPTEWRLCCISSAASTRPVN
jgi:pimeloyl-ACP methyl ester carboxylesterase